MKEYVVVSERKRVSGEVATLSSVVEANSVSEARKMYQGMYPQEDVKIVYVQK